MWQELVKWYHGKCDARQFIKICKKAGEPFPVKKIQLKFPQSTNKMGDEPIRRDRHLRRLMRRRGR